jgi:hypothetical protein
LDSELEYKPGAGLKSNFIDLEILALSLTAEFRSINGGNSLFEWVATSQISNLIIFLI